MKRHPNRSSARSLVNAVVLVLLVVSVFAAIRVNSHALAERRLEAQVSKVELAAHTIATIDLIDEVPSNVALEYQDAIVVLEDDFDGSLGAVSVASRAETVALVEEVLDSTTDGEPAPAETIRPLLSVLHESRLAVAGEAADAERQAQVLLGVATVTAVLAAVVLALGWRREARLRQSLRDQAHTDLLTGLPNRRAIETRTADARRAMRESKCMTGVLCLDLDGFKSVNDSMGHGAGDRLLEVVAERLVGACRGEESLLRLGGDEFAVMLPCIANLDEIDTAAARYLDAFVDPFVIDQRVEHVRTSIGVSVTDDPARVDELFTEADMAMFVAKRRGGHGIAHFEDAMREEAEATARVKRALRNANYDDEFHLVFQPVVSVTTGQVAFIEALLRWESPVLGTVSPGEFIPVAEASGEIFELGTWVVRNAIKALVEWQADPDFADIAVSCNVSAIQIADEAFVDSLLAMLSETGVSSDQLIVEVTESVAIGQSGTSSRVLQSLRDHGFAVAIDDFGAGYANLGQLFRVPFDILKVDRMFLVDLTERSNELGADQQLAHEVLSSVAQIANATNVMMVCEGVETDEQRSVLARAGVSHMQGWLTGRPVVAADLKLRPNQAAASLSPAS